MWLLGIAAIIVVAAFIVNYLVKWLNRNKKKPPVPDWDKQYKDARDVNENQGPGSIRG